MLKVYFALHEVRQQGLGWREGLLSALTLREFSSNSSFLGSKIFKIYLFLLILLSVRSLKFSNRHSFLPFQICKSS